MVDIRDYSYADQLAWTAKDEEIKQLCWDLDELFDAQFEWDRDRECDKYGTLEVNETKYREKLTAFKKKWFKENDEKARIERLCEYVDKKVEWLREELYEGIGKAV